MPIIFLENESDSAANSIYEKICIWIAGVEVFKTCAENNPFLFYQKETLQKTSLRRDKEQYFKGIIPYFLKKSSGLIKGRPFEVPNVYWKNERRVSKEFRVLTRVPSP